jgi:hypothetical protein
MISDPLESPHLHLNNNKIYYVSWELKFRVIESRERKRAGQPVKTLVPSYYGLYSLFNKIRNKGKIVSAGY